MFAVIRYLGKQFIASPGETITVPHVEGKAGDVIEISDVLLVSEDKKVSIGTPLVKGKIVKVKIISQHKGDKLTVRRYKSKVRYRKTRGFREQLTDVEILTIE